ncbi:peptidylprolyl isomerase [Flavobacterium psychrophilum]|uniref:peptidylprolyl isomerase n=1 Tax=Flavobacterium psychrophilum TaxID=96345 RepID=UPI000B7C3771|nr:peptidylprolyl isomerase [Flavobacterium psychrophilum]EKT3964789.1 peptidylprolyl isomerase [Flavobacterium psychrophilum]EKT4518239.1 peptidylprolyl isomerase [Flavobacterium psychrophilum]SNB05113.1 putative peptidyl-prolyl cis-trans isomerase [Flavobacterium psychrophilum]
MKINKIIACFALAINSLAFAQSDKKEVLFTIDDKPYYTDEFSRVYNKNIDLVKDESQKDLNKYMELFVGYKLKINKANKIGLQNNEKYINELKSYRTQLSKNYTSDTKVTKALIEEGYNRSLKEIRASHILITVDENAVPADTLKAYNQAIDIRKKALVGEKFEDLAVTFSQDPSSKENKGDLGYFSAFRMIYPFETVAYNTKKGQISMPVRTKFGYHLIYITDSRENRGEITVAHIMILKSPKAESEITTTEKAKATIQDIYTKLKQGENFESLASQFSQDKNSAPKGGLLPRFASGQLSSEEFENAAFALTKPKEYSAPFESQFGWHIVKLVEKQPIKKLNEMEKELDEKIRKDDRSRLITNSLTNKLRKKYTIVRNEKLYAQIKTLVTDKIYVSQWKLPANLKDYDSNLFKIENKSITGTQFLSILEAQQKSDLKIKPVGKLVDFVYQNFVDAQMTDYYNDNLEKEFPDFANVIEEYRDGLLLFDLMEKEIWEKAKQDTLALKKYYNANKLQYQWKNRAEVLVASSTKEGVAKEARKLLNKDQTDDFIKTTLNTKEVVNVMIKKENYEEGAENFPKKVDFKTGVSEIYKDGEFYFVNKVSKIIPASVKTFDEAHGRVVNDYQQYLEDNWVSNLKKEFKVNINQEVFERMKASMKK